MSRKVHTGDQHYDDDAERVVQKLKRIHDDIDSAYDEVKVGKLRIEAEVIASSYSHRPDVRHRLEKVQNKANARIMELRMRRMLEDREEDLAKQRG